MPGILRCDKINLNNPEIVDNLKEKLKEIIKESKFFDLRVYFLSIGGINEKLRKLFGNKTFVRCIFLKIACVLI